LVSNFAKQAVIAIENTRLLNELRQRTDDLSESLEQQTATSDVLQVISSSPGELGPVFQAMLEKAVELCHAKFGNLVLFKGGEFRVVAMHGAPRPYEDLRRRSPAIRPRTARTILGALMETAQVVHIADLAAEERYADSAIVKLASARTFLSVPMLKEGQLIGGIEIYRQEVRPFTDKQIELVKSFANQAVIAIENTRLLNELRESLQQQKGHQPLDFRSANCAQYTGAVGSAVVRWGYGCHRSSARRRASASCQLRSAARNDGFHGDSSHSGGERFRGGENHPGRGAGSDYGCPRRFGIRAHRGS
jgi:GAF domain-containing protein